MNNTLLNLLQIFLNLLPIVLIIWAEIFWLAQLVGLLRRDVRDFENQTHKLTWFIAIMVGNIIGAIWYSMWIYKKTKEADQKVRSALTQKTIEQWKQSEQKEDR